MGVAWAAERLYGAPLDRRTVLWGFSGLWGPDLFSLCDLFRFPLFFSAILGHLGCPLAHLSSSATIIFLSAVKIKAQSFTMSRLESQPPAQ